jgi:hypothetical protein
MPVVGGGNALTDLPVEHTWRNLRTCTLILPTVDRRLETTGNSGQGVQAQRFNFDAARLSSHEMRR